MTSPSQAQVVVSQKWDGVTPPALPSGFTAGTLVTTALQAYSGANSLTDNAAGTQDITENTATDGNGGTSYVQWKCLYPTVNSGANAIMGGMIRGTSTSNNQNGYCALPDSRVGLQLLKVIANANTQLGTTIGNSSTFAPGSWYQFWLIGNGTTLTARAQRLSDGYYLNPSGVWTASVRDAIVATDSTYTSAGYGGLRCKVTNTAVAKVYSDDFEFGASTIQVSSPAANQFYQRSAGGTASIAIRGTYTGSPTNIEASFNGSAFQTIATAPTGDTFSGTFTGAATGQGSLVCRFSNDTSKFWIVNPISVGDIFALWGQSNCGGRITANQPVMIGSNGITPMEFGNDYTWKKLVDPVDSSVGQVDTVSSDSGSIGSIWPLLGAYITAKSGVPVAFMPCPLSATTISQWLPGGSGHSDRTTLYGSGNYRATTVGGIKAVLWWQGESDGANGTSQATYQSTMATLAADIAADQGVKLIPCELQTCSTSWATTPHQAAIRAAIAAEWTGDANVLPGPDLSSIDVSTDDVASGVHLKSNRNAYLAASLWWVALESLYYPPPGSSLSRSTSISKSITSSRSTTSSRLLITVRTTLH